MIGLLSPVTFALKSLFQAVCISGIAWEDVLGADARRVWERWLSGAEKVREFEMPRCYIPEILSCSEVVLVGFCVNSYTTSVSKFLASEKKLRDVQQRAKGTSFCK